MIFSLSLYNSSAFVSLIIFKYLHRYLHNSSLLRHRRRSSNGARRFFVIRVVVDGGGVVCDLENRLVIFGSSGERGWVRLLGKAALLVWIASLVTGVGVFFGGQLLLAVVKCCHFHLLD